MSTDPVPSVLEVGWQLNCSPNPIPSTSSAINPRPPTSAERMREMRSRKRVLAAGEGLNAEIARSAVQDELEADRNRHARIRGALREQAAGLYLVGPWGVGDPELSVRPFVRPFVRSSVCYVAKNENVF